MSPNIPGNFLKHSGQCPQTLRGMLLNIPGMLPNNGNIVEYLLTTAIFVDNSNIDECCLNNRKLHLSKKGTQLLSKNILRSLEGHWNTSQKTIGNDIRNSHLSCSQDFSHELKYLRIENLVNPIFAYLNINSIRNKFNGNTDVVMIAETKIDASFTIAQFLLDNYHQSFRLDINSKSGGILVYVNHQFLHGN